MLRGFHAAPISAPHRTGRPLVRVVDGGRGEDAGDLCSILENARSDRVTYRRRMRHPALSGLTLAGRSCPPTPAGKP